MSKLLLPLLCLCLAGWLFGGSVWFGNQFSSSSINASWQLQDGKAQFNSPTTFSFQTSDAEIILDDNQLGMISQIAQYLDAHSDRILNLTGSYTKAEINNSDYENLGLARAESFRYIFFRQGIDMSRLIVEGKQVEAHQLNSNGLIHGGVDFSFMESPIIKYGPSFSSNKKIEYKAGSEDIVTEDFEAYVASIRQYLVDYPQKKLLFTGYSKSVDYNTITQKRVLGLKNILVQKGISKEKMKSGPIQTDQQHLVDSHVEIKIN